MIATVKIRRLRSGDVGALSGVLARAYVSQQNFDWRLRSYASMPRVAAFVAECDGEPVGMVVGNDYGPLAYVSQMAVDPPLQRRGVGSALMDALTGWADERRFAALELDATESGEPLYARFGFVRAGQTVVYQACAGDADPWAARRFGSRDRAALLAIDARAFGADRSHVLRLLLDMAPNVAVVCGSPGSVDGYAVAQPGSELLGPVIAPNAVVAARLVAAARAYLPGAHRLSVPSGNRAAHSVVVAGGYRRTRSLAHMVRGTRPPAAAELLFARINLGQG